MVGSSGTIITFAKPHIFVSQHFHHLQQVLVFSFYPLIDNIKLKSDQVELAACECELGSSVK